MLARKRHVRASLGPAATLATHFGYGTLGGIVYALDPRPAISQAIRTMATVPSEKSTNASAVAMGAPS